MSRLDLVTEALEGLKATEHLDEDWAVPCTGRLACYPDPQAAEWLVHFVACCPKRVPVEAWCTGCKDVLVEVADNATCHHCQQQWHPASTAVRLIEPLNRRTT